ncbi:hypothetical protein M2272_000529 [Mycobacterium frederiksbergense]|uniref:Uncharacterized protein n=1 Tax=Mycolicibacterium frederiksbergense TaxID=117567 RepID=A0ABT6KTI2_9MYCO|nr:hypothetical protein [Mycolicibacterium frederiksbergense]MDH6193908.1 hypothetical protein [Mycolicibacterium frederiksbergense]
MPAPPISFRVGYTDYLRTASTSDLLIAVLPGLAGMTLMTAAGGADVDGHSYLVADHFVYWCAAAASTAAPSWM